MHVQLNMEALQSYLVEDRAIQFLGNAVHAALNQSELFSASFEIERLKFGTHPPSIQLLSMKDIDVATQWSLHLHTIPIPNIGRLPFDAPFQADLQLNCDSDCSMIFHTTLSYDQISPGCIKFPIKASISRLVVQGRISVNFLGDAIVILMQNQPELNLDLILQLGGEEKLEDDGKIRDLLLEVMKKWIEENLIPPNALQFIFPE
jgi:hypothetical protein